ncbi:MAG TPA: hypothetical protein P5038_21565 [Candidatus Paceibacterota bacterium]|nr:hypothetical protein [Candidatus Paceibacterota bacterium]
MAEVQDRGALKAIEETASWLELAVESGVLPAAKPASLLDEANPVAAILTTTDKKAKRSGG